MENASDALIMAGQVLIFIVALTVCISSFTTVRSEVDRILGSEETVRFAKGDQGYINFIESKEYNSVRVVGAETLVPTMYRAIKENYVVYIKLSNLSNLNEKIPIKIATQTININSKDIICSGDPIIEISIGYENGISKQNVSDILNSGLYEKIKDKQFNEYLGEYQQPSAEGVSSIEKQTYRIVTYVETSE